MTLIVDNIHFVDKLESDRKVFESNAISRLDRGSSDLLLA